MKFDTVKNLLLTRHDWQIVGMIHEALKCQWTEEEVRIFIRHLPGYSVFDIFASLPEFMQADYDEFYRQLETLTRMSGNELIHIKEEILDLLLENIPGENYYGNSTRTSRQS